MHSLQRSNLLAGLVLAASLGVTYVLWQQAQQQVMQKLHSEFDFHAHEIVDRLQQRMSAYEQVLLGVRAFFDSSEVVNRDEFNSYVSSLNLDQDYPGIQGVSYAQIVPASRKAQHIASIRQQGFPDYTIHPSGERDIYMVVTYIEPFTKRNARVLGYDTWAETVRRTAQQQARDSGRATLTGKLKLVQETGEQVQTGLLMFLPLYEKGASLDKPEDRRANLTGYVTAVFRTGDLMAGLGHERSAELDLEIYDGEEISELTRMYDSDGVPVNLDAEDSRLKSIQHITIADHDWTLVIQSSANFEARIDNTKPVFVAASGFVFSILLALLVLAYLRSKNISRELQESEERWRFALEGAGDGVWDWNLQSNEVHFSRQWKAMLGHTEDEIENQLTEWKERVHPDDLQKALDDIEAHVSGKTSTYINEHRLRHKNGSWVWILDRGMVISHDNNGKPLRMIGTHADITDQKQVVEELYESERYNRMLFEQSPIGFALCHMNGELVDINLAYAEMTGRNIEETLQLTYWEITPESYAADEQRQLENLKLTGHYGPYEKEYIHKNGHLVPVCLHGQLLEKGGETFIWSSVEDITERKQAERQIEMHVNRLQKLSELSMTLTGDPVDVFRDAVRMISELLDVRVVCLSEIRGDELYFISVCVDGEVMADVGHCPLEITPCATVEDSKDIRVYDRVAERFPKAAFLKTHDAFSYCGFPALDNSGKVVAVTCLLDDKPHEFSQADQSLLRIFGQRIGLEIERQRSDETVRDSEQRFRQLTENINEVFWLGTPDWNEVLYVSPAYEKNWGQSAQALYDKPRTWIEAVHPDDREQVVADIPKNPTEIGDLVEFREYRIQKPDGSIVWIKARVYPIRDDGGKLIRVAGIAEDISERKQAEDELKNLNATLEARVVERTHELELARNQADAASQAKTEFLSNMSHEIRSPLASIIGFSESLMTDDFNEQERKQITSTIVRNGNHLLRVVNDILDLSKIEAGQLEVELINSSIFLLLGEVDSLVGMNAREKGLKFKINYHFPLPESIVTDPTCLKQILINLCSNAIKFTNEGSIEVDVSCDSDFRQLKIVVSDSGIGMTAEEILRVFDPFTQADSSTTRQYGGTGLGLSISSKLAKALNGSLTCESRKGQGSQFTLAIANQDEGDVVVINRLEDVSLHYDEKSELVEIKPLAGSILLVEDSPDNQQLISMFIRKTGAQVSIAENGKRAVELALEREFDLILMDMQMPIMDGLEAIRQLRAGGYKRPIVSLTANVMLSDREKCEAAGADDYLAKPIELHHFYHVLNTYLSEDKNKASNGKKQDLQKAMEDSPQFKAMVERFIAKLPQMIDEVTNALAEKNWDELQAKSHDLKGMGGSLGYPEITEKAGLINTLVKQKNYVQLADASAELEKLCRSIIQQRGTKNV